jgi:hypothetical protein
VNDQARSITPVEIPGEIQTRPACSRSRNCSPTSQQTSRRAVCAGSASSIIPAGKGLSNSAPLPRGFS